MLFAADFWKTKDSSQWTDDEISKILSDSPWAKAKTVQPQQTAGQTARHGPPRWIRISRRRTRVEDIRAAAIQVAVVAIRAAVAVIRVAVAVIPSGGGNRAAEITVTHRRMSR